ncbi:MAG: hypothetical protein OXC97_00630 [Candidatus Dadabacteria bacterium]|nr:hypothetical protein [Candidatus Dadabacteria bacterium]
MSDKKKEWDKVNQAAKLIFNMAAVSHKRPKKPNKQDLNRKFSLKKDRKGNPKIKEVE